MVLTSKRGFLLRSWVVAFITFVALVSLCYFMVYGMATKYDKTAIIDSEFNSTFNKFANLSEDVEEMKNATVGKGGLRILEQIGVIWGATTSVIEIVFESLTLPGAMMEKASDYAGAPSTIGNILFILPLLLITTLVVFVVISAVSRTKV